MEYTTILLAAGSGSRMNLGFNKMFIQIHGQSLLELSLQPFIKDPDCTQIIIVVNDQEVNTISEQIHHKKCTLVIGGKERQDSVYNGLQHVKNTLLFVHDGARPFISQKLITQLKEKGAFGCAIPGVPVKDTIKKVEQGIVRETLTRTQLYAIQTPQVVLTAYLRNAHEKAKHEHFLGTDEASLIERYTDIPVQVVESSYENIKITTSIDLLLANELYKLYF